MSWPITAPAPLKITDLHFPAETRLRIEDRWRQGDRIEVRQRPGDNFSLFMVWERQSLDPVADGFRDAMLAMLRPTGEDAR